MNDRVLAIIPAYNEVARIVPVIRGARPYVREVVVVDDGSTDGTGQVARQEGATVLRQDPNQGKGAAIHTGLGYFQASSAEFAVFLDADGQHDPAEIPGFVAQAEATGAGIVCGTRMAHTETMPFVRKVTNWMTSRLTARLARQEIPDSQCGYRLLARKVLPVLHLSTAHFETETEMLIQAGRAGHRIASQPIRTIYESGRSSHIRPVRDSIRFFHLVKRYWA